MRSFTCETENDDTAGIPGCNETQGSTAANGSASHNEDAQPTEEKRYSYAVVGQLIQTTHAETC